MEKDYVLYNGVSIPAVAFGTWQIPEGEIAYQSTLNALKAGYRHIDTAYAYHNEVSVGKAIKDSGLKREDVFITTKLPAEIKTAEGAYSHFNQSLNNLGVDYIDLYLIHAPWPWSDVGGEYTSGNIEVWKVIISLYNQGKIRSIGVSNFHEKDIVALIEATGIKPMVNQIRFFLGNTQENITKYCQDNNILVEAYSPLATGRLLDDEILNNIARKYHKTPAQICLKYCLIRNTLPIPKTTHEERIIQNIDLDFSIDEKDVHELEKIHNPDLNKKLRS